MMFCKSLLMILLALLVTSTAHAEDPTWTVNLTVKDSSGEPVAQFEAMAATQYTSSDWAKGENGKATVTDSIKTYYGGRQFLDYQIIVRSPGYAPGMAELKAEPNGTAEAEVVLTPASYKLTITSEDGRELPADLKPLVVLEPYLPRALRGMADTKPEARNQWDFCSVQAQDKGAYAYSAAADMPFYVFVDHPGFLRGFVDGPFKPVVEQDGLKIVLPAPGEMSVAFKPAEDTEEVPYAFCTVYLYRLIPSLRTSTTLVATSAKGAVLQVDKDFYVPGDYGVNISTQPAEEVERGAIHPGLFRNSEQVTVEAGKETTVKVTYKPYSPDFYKGEVKATVVVQTAGGKPVAGEKYTISCRHPNYGDTQVAEGTLDDNGQMVLAGLGANSYSLQVGEDRAGHFTMAVSGEEKEVTETFKFPPTTGDEAPDISLQEAFSDKTAKLSDFRGKVVFVDFWATWCGPCQGPMGHLNELWPQRKADWEGKVVLIGASVDETKDVLQKHIEKKDWNKIAQYWCHEKAEGAAFGAVAATAYGVSGVPTSLLIDQKGIIVWRGHPGSVDLEAEVAKLLESN